MSPKISPHLSAVPKVDSSAAEAERARLGSLLDQAARAAAAPHLVAADTWAGTAEAHSARAVASVLDAAARVLGAEHVGHDAVRSTCWTAVEVFTLGLAF
jgi:hypothetical protein